MPSSPPTERTARTAIGEIARLFLKLGTIVFGGPAAHVAMMEDEVVRRRGWLTRDEFLDYLGARFRLSSVWLVVGGAALGLTFGK